MTKPAPVAPAVPSPQSHAVIMMFAAGTGIPLSVAETTHDVEAGIVDFAQLTVMIGVNGAVQFMGYPTGVTESRLFGSDSRTIL